MPSRSTETAVVYKSLAFMGYPDYRVGDDGSVWSKRRGAWKKLSLKVTNKHGHLVAALRNGNGLQYRLVHRLVLLAFVGPCPPGMQCCHFPDRDPGNNRLCNLMWGTPTTNSKHRDVHGTSNKGERNGAAKTDEETVKRVRELWASGLHRQKEIAKMCGLTKANVWCIVHRISWDYL